MDEAKDADVKQQISESTEEQSENKNTGEEGTEASETQSESNISEREKFYQSMVKPGVTTESEATSTEENEDETSETASDSKTTEGEGEPDGKLEDRIKDKISKRIGKEVGKRKEVEEELAELKTKLEELEKSKKVEKEEIPTEPTEEQIIAYIAEQTREGNYEEAAKAQIYAINQAKKTALDDAKKVANTTKKTNEESQKKWVSLVKDFTIYNDDKTIDMNHPLNLNNRNSALFTTALGFMNDPDIAREYGYDNPDKVLGFRLAVNDARRELVEASERGELDLKAHKPKAKKKLIIEPSKRRKSELAAPESESVDSSETRAKVGGDKATDEIARRNEMKRKGMAQAAITRS